MKEMFSFPVDSRVIVFNDMNERGEILFLYGDNVDIRTRAEVFRDFMRIGLNNMALCMHAYDNKTSKLNFDMVFKDYISEGQLSLLPMNVGPKAVFKELSANGELLSETNSKISELFSHLENGNFQTMRLILDFGMMATEQNIHEFLDVHARLKEMGEAFPVSSITAFSMSNLDYDSAQMLLGNYSKVLVSTNTEQTVITPTFSSFAKESTVDTPIDVISQESMERFVKKSLDAIIMAILREKPMCGYDVIKTIFHRFHILLSQGTVYPMLYSMREEGLLEIMGENSRTRIYRPTEKGNVVMETKLAEYKKTQQFLLDSLNI